MTKYTATVNHETVIKLGTSVTCHVKLVAGSPTVSAVIENQPDSWYYLDLGNGSKINDKEVKLNKIAIESGDLITIGEENFIFVVKEGIVTISEYSLPFPGTSKEAESAIPQFDTVEEANQFIRDFAVMYINVSKLLQNLVTGTVSALNVLPAEQQYSISGKIWSGLLEFMDTIPEEGLPSVVRTTLLYGRQEEKGSKELQEYIESLVSFHKHMDNVSSLGVKYLKLTMSPKDRLSSMFESFAGL